MKTNAQLVIAAGVVVLASLGASAIMYSVTENMSPLAFAGWVIFFAAPQIALLPAYKTGTCRIMDRLAGRK